MATTIPNLATANVRAEGARRGYSMHQLSREAGLTPSLFYRHLRDGNWRLSELAAIEAALDLPAGSLTGSRS